MTTSTYNQGYSLVEVLIAISILLLAMVGPMTIASKALQSAQYAREQNTSFFLAQEGIEAVVAIRNEYGLAHIDDPTTADSNDWLSTPLINNCDSSGSDGCGFHFDDDNFFNDSFNCPSGGCPLYFDLTNTRARYSHDNGGALTPYTRAVYVDQTSDNGAIVRSVVTWQPIGNLPMKTVELKTYLYDIYNTN